jgi:hypothetical protein
MKEVDDVVVRDDLCRGEKCGLGQPPSTKVAFQQSSPYLLFTASSRHFTIVPFIGLSDAVG